MAQSPPRAWRTNRRSRGDITLSFDPIPPARAGQKIGLFGGSFDPPHAGHLHVARTALIRLGLDRIWWMASPQNPLKHFHPAPMAKRLEAIEELIDCDVRQIATGFEASMGFHVSCQTIQHLRKVRPNARFVWIMGADSLAGFHHWQRWRYIMQTLPVAVFARPNHRLPARVSPAARRFKAARLPGRAAKLLACTEAPAWCFLNTPMRSESSTALRSMAATPCPKP